jgi:hypothetical protein
MLWMKKGDQQQPGIKGYWQETSAVSRPMAIILTILIMFIILAVVFSLFLGGKWLYANLTDNKNKPVEVTQTTSGGGTITDVGPAASTTTNNPSSNKGNAAAPTKLTATPKPTPSSVANTLSNSSLPGSGPNELPGTGPLPE